MNLIEKAAGFVPVASEKAKAAWKFVSSTMGKTVIAGVTVLAFLAWVYHRGEDRGAASVATLQEQVATLTSQLAAADKLAGEVKKDADFAHWKADSLTGRLQSSDALTSQLNKKVDDYAREIAASKKLPACTVTPADVRSLQRIQ
jgi:hypothetical protein